MSVNSQPTPSGTGSSPSGDPSRTKPLRQQYRAPVSSPRRLTHCSMWAGGAPSASTCWSAFSSSSTPWDSRSPSGRPSSASRRVCSSREASALASAGRRSASISTTAHDASSNSDSLSAIDRSRSIWALHLGERAVHPAGVPPAPSTGAAWLRTSNPAAVLGHQRELVHLASGRVHGRQQQFLRLAGVGATGRPPVEAAPPDRLLGAPAQDADGLGVPVRDHPVLVERAKTRFHAVEQSREQLFVTFGLCVKWLHVTTFNPGVGCVTRDLHKSVVRVPIAF